MSLLLQKLLKLTIAKQVVLFINYMKTTTMAHLEYDNNYYFESENNLNEPNRGEKVSFLSRGH